MVDDRLAPILGTGSGCTSSFRRMGPRFLFKPVHCFSIRVYISLNYYPGSMSDRYLYSGLGGGFGSHQAHTRAVRTLLGLLPFYAKKSIVL